jgi:hypothetical protein
MEHAPHKVPEALGRARGIVQCAARASHYEAAERRVTFIIVLGPRVRLSWPQGCFLAIALTVHPQKRVLTPFLGATMVVSKSLVAMTVLLKEGGARSLDRNLSATQQPVPGPQRFQIDFGLAVKLQINSGYSRKLSEAGECYGCYTQGVLAIRRLRRHACPPPGPPSLQAGLGNDKAYLHKRGSTKPRSGNHDHHPPLVMRAVQLTQADKIPLRMGSGPIYRSAPKAGRHYREFPVKSWRQGYGSHNVDHCRLFCGGNKALHFRITSLPRASVRALFRECRFVKLFKHLGNLLGG